LIPRVQSDRRSQKKKASGSQNISRSKSRQRLDITFRMENASTEQPEHSDIPAGSGCRTGWSNRVMPKRDRPEKTVAASGSEQNISQLVDCASPIADLANHMLDEAVLC